MDKEFRELERRVAAEPSALPLLLRAAVRIGKLEAYKESIPTYFQLFSQDEFETKLAQSNPDYYFRDYQKTLITFHLGRQGSGNFSDLGTLKFDTALAALRVMFEDDIAGLLLNKCLVLCVPACRPQIETAIERIAPEHQSKIRVVTYSRSWRIEEELLNENYPIVICDEAHRIKNCQTRQGQTAYKLGDQALYKIALTGCPILNRIEDVFGLMRFIEPTLLGKSWFAFLKKYFDTSYSSVAGSPIPQRTPKLGVEKELSDMMYLNGIRFLSNNVA